jgi:hypothetical protein
VFVVVIKMAGSLHDWMMVLKVILLLIDFCVTYVFQRNINTYIHICMCIHTHIYIYIYTYTSIKCLYVIMLPVIKYICVFSNVTTVNKLTIRKPVQA